VSYIRGLRRACPASTGLKVSLYEGGRVRAREKKKLVHSRKKKEGKSNVPPWGRTRSIASADEKLFVERFHPPKN